MGQGGVKWFSANGKALVQVLTNRVVTEECDAKQEAFVLGAIVGAAVVWLWGRGMEEYVEERTRGVRTKARMAFGR